MKIDISGVNARKARILSQWNKLIYKLGTSTLLIRAFVLVFSDLENVINESFAIKQVGKTRNDMRLLKNGLNQVTKSAKRISDSLSDDIDASDSVDMVDNYLRDSSQYARLFLLIHDRLNEEGLNELENILLNKPSVRLTNEDILKFKLKE